MASDFTVCLSAEETAFKIRNIIEGGSITGELLDEYVVPFSSGRSIVQVYEKHYYRAGNRLTLTVVLSEADDGTRIHLIGGGGGEGLFRFDWGASESFESSVLYGLEKHRIR